MLLQERVWLMLLVSLTVVMRLYGATVGDREQDDNQELTVLTGHNEAEREGCLPLVPPVKQSTDATEDISCDEEQPVYNHVMDDFLSALNNGWNRESELGKAEFQRFGICSHLDGGPDFQLSALPVLAERAHHHRNGFKGFYATKVELLDAEKNGEIILALRFPRSAHLTSLVSMTLLFSVDSSKADGFRMSFNSHSLHPNKQTVCISDDTRFLILTGGQRESHTHGHLKLRITVETLKTENDQKPSVTELREVLMKKVDGSNTTMRPMFLFFSDREYSDVQRTPDFKYQGILQNQRTRLAPSRTFVFLCELQKFLNDILPQQEHHSTLQEGSSAVSLDTLNSLPPLRLGMSSTESLLSGLVNSSTLTIFVFPQKQQDLQTHQVELSLDPSLLSVLRLRLDEAMIQVRKEEAGQRMIDRLQRLTELSALPPDGVDEAVTKDHKEAQYRSVLLLKALQMVLSTWEVERAQRAARSDQDGPLVSSQCRLQSLNVSLRKFFLEPSTANINNCEGVCGFPLTGSNENNHVILLNSLIQSGQPVNRSPCCVPVDYRELCVIELESEGTHISFKTNMVATKCGCR